MSDPIHDIREYSDAMTIGTLMKFLKKKGLDISRAMIQNYIRLGLLPPPKGKRFYGHKHIAALVTIFRLKAAFDIDMIKDILLPHMDDEGLPLEVYELWHRESAVLSEAFFSHGEDFSDASVLVAAGDVVGRLRGGFGS